MNQFNLDRTQNHPAPLPSSDNLLKPEPSFYHKDFFNKENSFNNSNIDMMYTPIKTREKRIQPYDTPFSILKSINEDSACIQTRSRKLHDSALPLEHWKNYDSNLKRPKNDKTPFEEFFEISEKKALEMQETELDHFYFLAFNESILDKRESIEDPGMRRPNISEKLVFDTIPVTAEKKTVKQTLINDAKDENNKSGGCNCEKSKCLQMYCDCLKQGNFCGPNCFCCNCENKEDSDQRRKKINQMQKKNPDIFKRVVSVKNSGEQNKVYSKGCNCKKSGCLKKYCECHQNGALCSDHCRCQDCKNTKEHMKKNKGADNKKQNSGKSSVIKLVDSSFS